MTEVIHNATTGEEIVVSLPDWGTDARAAAEMQAARQALVDARVQALPDDIPRIDTTQEAIVDALTADLQARREAQEAAKAGLAALAAKAPPTTVPGLAARVKALEEIIARLV